MLTTIDLFCGAGGLTEGFRQAKYRCLYANDINAWAIKTFNANHTGNLGHCHPIEDIDAKVLRRKLGLSRGQLSVLVGGPPCQGFSINAPERFLEDPRNALFTHYIRFLKEFEPRALLIENVPGMLSLENGHVFKQIINELTKAGYHTSARIMFAAHYGVPQERWRLIILGTRESPPPEHPYPTHYALGRPNFTGSRTMTFALTPIEQFHLARAITVKDALSDLPKLCMGEGSEIGEYDCSPQTEYQRELRADQRALYNHYAAVLAPQNALRMKHIKPGGSWRDIPRELLPKGMLRARASDHTKRYGRLHYDRLSATIMTKCDPHWSAVFLPDQDRTLTVREAARLQSFPDRYRFLGPRVAQYEQVGNAVPVKMVRAIAEQLDSHLCQNTKRAVAS